MAGVGEMLASAVVDKVCKKLVNLLAVELTLLWDFRKEIESLKSTLFTIRAVLSDAEMRSLRKEAETERLWLERLKSAAYEIDDMLSDFEASITPKMARRRNEVKSFFSSSNSLISCVALARNMKDLRKRLDTIVSERRDFDFKVDISSNRLLGVLEIKNRETFSEIVSNEKSKIVGRDEEKEKLINILLQRDVGEGISTILIIGLGGLGKTTLAQLIFNDESIEKEFEIRVWIYVSMNFDLLNIGKTILSQIDSRGQHDDSLQYITTRLKSSLSSKKFLIVLDDLWEEDGQNLEKLIVMLSGGKYGSKVIVTTRSPRVAQLMSSPNAVIYSLEGVSDEDCWSIFSQRAFVHRDDVDPSLVAIGKDIIKKCKGVPLAAVALGYILRSNKDIVAWSAVRDSEFWELNDDGVLPSLKLSYYQMTAPLKLCFAYCAMFSKGCDINKDKLIQQWIALEFIQDTNGHFTPEKIGEDYVSNLLGISFLHYSPNYEGSHNLVRMHDLVHDMARSVVGDEILVLDARKEINGNKNHVGGCSYYSLVANCDYMGKSPDLTFLPDKVRALHFNNCTPMRLPGKGFKHKRSLRVLNFNTCQVDNLPDSIYHLKQLRYLEASLVKAKSLPESFGNLLNIITIDLSKSSLEELPNSINKLLKLKNLSLNGCSLLQELPESFSELELLINLDLSGCSSLEELPELFGKLSSLRFLCLSGCLKLMRLPETIGNIEGLSHLNLSDCRSLRKLPESFENLRKLKSLDLSGIYELQNLPQSFPNLESLQYLNLSLCNKLDRLPERFGNLKDLKILNLSSCTLRSLPKSFGSLMNLEKLDLSYCCNLEELPESILNSDKLQMLDLRGSNLIKFVSNVENLVRTQEGFVLLCDEMFECKEIKQGGKLSSTIVRLEHLNQIRGKLHITRVEIVHNSEEAERAKLCNKSKLGSLTLQWSRSTCESLEDAKKDKLVLEKLQPHQNIEFLTLSGYRGTRFPSWVMMLESSTPNLTHITLCNLPYCEQLPPFERLANLKSLELQDAPKIERIQTKMQLLEKLRVLSIMDMPELEEWSLVGSTNDMKSNLESKMQNHSGLQFLSLSGCRNLRELPESFGNLQKLKTLDLSGCNKLDRLPECFGNLKDLESLDLSSCIALRKIPESFFYLHNLESLDLSYCLLVEYPKFILNNDKIEVINLRYSNLVNFPDNTERFVNSQAGSILLWTDEIFECKEISQGGKHCSSIGRLEHLNQIQGTLHITHVEAIHSLEDAEKAKLCNKSKISSLILQWSGSTCGSLEDARREELLLEKLQPHNNLKFLTLDGYRGPRLPSWVMGLESSLLNLTQITMCNLPHCEQLELSEHLINLEILEIHNSPNVNRIQLKMLFKLRMLSIRDMPTLEELSVAGLIVDINAKLESLEINRCPRVIIKPYLPSTETSLIVESSMALSSAGVPSMLPKPRISKMDIESCNVTSDEWGGLAVHVNIVDLEIKSCKDLYFFPKSILGLTSLESLTIKDCNSLSDLPEWLGELVSLRSLSIILCRKLKLLPSSIYGLTTLKNLHIIGCNFVLFGQHIHKVIISNPVIVFSGRSEEAYDKMEILEELGKGIFGPTKKAKLKMGQIVAVKFLRNMDANVWKIWDKIIPLGGMNHPHVMSLQAYQIGRDKDMLVYDFMPMCSLSSWLHNTRFSLPLHWSTRSRIILDVAHGLEHIHSISPRCAHGNITASNVLVFCNNTFSSKELPERATISNYGLAHLVGGPATSGYKAPELTNLNQAAQKSDVYSFGVLLLEMLTGRNPEHDDGESRYLPGWVEKNIHGQLFYGDPSRNNLLEAQEMKQILQLAMECVSSESESRPTMRRVARRIEDICKLMKIMPARSENIESSVHQHEEQAHFWNVDATW